MVSYMRPGERATAVVRGELQVSHTTAQPDCVAGAAVGPDTAAVPEEERRLREIEEQCLEELQQVMTLV